MSDNTPSLSQSQDDSPMLARPACEICSTPMEVMTEMSVSLIDGGRLFVREVLGKSWECPNWRNHRTED